MSEIEFAVDDGVGVLTLNRPARRNAFTLSMIDLWAETLTAAARDSAVRVVVLTGAGKGFCSGIDFRELDDIEDSPIAHRQMLTSGIHQVAHAVESLDKPLIAAVNGSAVGAGMDMALMCDVRYMATSASFCEGYIDAGLIPGDGGCYYLPRIVGESKALELLWTGDTVTAAEAVGLGLATGVFADDDLLDEVSQLARRIASKAPLPVQLIKSTVRRSRRMDVASSLDLAASHAAVIMATEDFREGRRAARDRREPPRYTGR